ncbi:MAG: glycine cleavage system protein T, partial [Pseudonocardiaceae bacterium]
MSPIEENPGILLYTRIRRSPYFHSSRKHGVKRYSVYNHFYHPRHYGDPVAEYWHLVNEVTMWDVGVERQIEITGPDAFAFVNMLVPRDLHKCKVSQCKYVFITAPDGGIINDPVLLRLEENRFLLSLADSDVDLWAMGVAYHSGLDVTIREIDIAPLQIQGPKAKGVMSDLFGESILDLPYYDLAQDLKLDGMDVFVSRTGYSGEIGYEIYLQNASRHATALWDRLLEVGRPHDLAVIGPCQIRRVEAGILSYGSDIALDNNAYSDYGFLNPYEADLGWTVDLHQEADFIGRAALERLAAAGVSRKVVGVEIGGDPLIGYFEDYLPVVDGEDQIGQVSSAFWS